MFRDNSGALLFVLLLWAVVAYAVYWVIRLAVRHALRDVLGRGGGTEFLLSPRSSPPRPGPGHDAD